MNSLAPSYDPPRGDLLNWPWLRSNGLAAAVALALHGALIGGFDRLAGAHVKTARATANADHPATDPAASAGARASRPGGGHPSLFRLRRRFLRQHLCQRRCRWRNRSTP